MEDCKGLETGPAELQTWLDLLLDNIVIFCALVGLKRNEIAHGPGSTCWDILPPSEASSDFASLLWDLASCAFWQMYFLFGNESIPGEASTSLPLASWLLHDSKGAHHVT